MKKIITIILSIILAALVAACGSTNSQADGKVQPQANTKPTAGSGTAADAASVNAAGNKKILIAYFTMPETDGVDAVAGASRVIVNGELLGNTQYMAQLIQKSVGGDLFAIQTAEPYPGIHKPLVDQAAQEKENRVRPALASKVENLKDYDVIFIGYPNWWADMPMPLYSFLEQNDLSGKRIIPFATHGGSEFSRTISDIGKLQPNATVVTNGLAISRNNVADAAKDVTAWIKQLNL